MKLNDRVADWIWFLTFAFRLFYKACSSLKTYNQASKDKNKKQGYLQDLLDDTVYLVNFKG